MKTLKIKLRALEKKVEELERAEVLLCREIQKHSDLEIGVQSLGGDGYGVYSLTVSNGDSLAGMQQVIEAIEKDGRLNANNFDAAL